MSAQIFDLQLVFCIFLIVCVSYIADFKAFLRLMQIRLANNQSIFIFLTYQFPSSGIHIRNTNRRRISRIFLCKIICFDDISCFIYIAAFFNFTYFNGQMIIFIVPIKIIDISVISSELIWCRIINLISRV